MTNRHFIIKLHRRVDSTLSPRLVVTMNLLQRARDSGNCPPSLLSEDRIVNDDGFETKVLNLLDPTVSGTSLFRVCFYVCLSHAFGVLCPSHFSFLSHSVLLSLSYMYALPQE